MKGAENERDGGTNRVILLMVDPPDSQLITTFPFQLSSPPPMLSSTPSLANILIFLAEAHPKQLFLFPHALSSRIFLDHNHVRPCRFREGRSVLASGGELRGKGASSNVKESLGEDREDQGVSRGEGGRGEVDLVDVG